MIKIYFKARQGVSLFSVFSVFGEILPPSPPNNGYRGEGVKWNNKMVTRKIFQFYSNTLKFLKNAMPYDEQIQQHFSKLASPNIDPWGLDVPYYQKVFKTLIPLYRHYFKVRVFGSEYVQDRPYILTSNHSGQIPIDGLLIGMAMLLDVRPPRIVRPMIERFMAKLPFIAEASFKAGAVLGDRQNCLKLMEQGQSVLIFPEGAKGITKSTSQFYQLQSFTRGFFRMALAGRREILPIAVVGAEELYPFVYSSKGLGKLLGLPALPITPLFPWLGVLGVIPLPGPIDIYIGPAISLPEGLNENAPNKEIDPYIFQVKQTIQNMLEEGIKKKRKFINPKEILRDFGLTP